MSNLTPDDMDSFLQKITNTTDTKLKLSICSKLLTYLEDADNSIECSDIGLFIDTLVRWLQSSNFKLIQIDLDILTALVNRMRTDFQPYLTMLLPSLVDKLGDSKVREKALNLLICLVRCDVVTLQNLFDKIAVACFTHKNSNVREQIMCLLMLVLDEYGSKSLSISKLVPDIVKLLSDPNELVRKTAFDTLCHIYRHVGERLRSDLSKKYSVPHNKLPDLMKKFDEIQATDGLSCAFQSLKFEDETDQSDKSSVKSYNSISASRPPPTPSGLGLSSLSMKSKYSSFRKPNGTSNDAGGVDENAFLVSFENLPHVDVYSCRDVATKLKECYKMIENKDGDWKKRVNSLMKVRSLIVAGFNYDDFHSDLRQLLPPFDKPLKDLRSSVVREACITVAFLSKNLGNKLDYFAESVLQDLINLIQSSTKVMATSGIVCIRFILRYTHSPRLISRIAEPIFDHHSQQNKSKEIRKACCEFIYLILQTWPTNSIEKNQTAFSNLQQAIKKGLEDADADARAHSRNAYQEFSVHFPLLAEGLTKSLGDRNRKYLNSNSNSGSNSSLSRIPATVTKNISVRSNSAIDLQAAKRANTRAQYAAMSRQKASSSGVSTITPKTRNQSTPQSNDQRVGRTKSRISVSQPTSRSGSPSSRLSYTNYLCSSGSISRSSKRYGKPMSAQKMLQQSREAETELMATLGSPSLSYSFKLSRGLEDHSDESETSSICSEHSFDSYRRPSDTMSWNGSQHGLYHDYREPTLKDIGDIIANCENAHWNERREGLQSLQYYLQEGNKLELGDLKRIMDVFTKIFNDPHIKVFSLFLDSLNEVIRCHHEDLCYCLHLLLTRLFNKLGTDLLKSVYSKIMKTLDIVFDAFPPELQLQSVFRFLVDPTQTPNSRVKLAALNYIIKLTTVIDPCNAFSSNIIDSCKDYPTMALEKMVSWTMTDNLKIGPELRRVSREAVLALFNLHPSQVARRFSSMPRELQEAAANSCKNRSYTSENNDSVDTSTPNSLYSGSSGGGGIARTKFTLDREHLSPYDNGISAFDKERSITEYQIKDNDVLKTYIEELSQCPTANDRHRCELINKITSVVQSSPSDVIISNFKPLLLTICSLLVPTESPTIKELSFNLLQIIAKRKTVTFLLKNISDLVITKTIALANDSDKPDKNVVKAAENCAITLATSLPAESVIRVVVPLITSEDSPAKLVAIKMLTRTIECSDGAIAMAEIDHIMNALLAAYNDEESLIRKAAVFCMVALHKQSEEMKACLEPYFNRLQGAKLKLVQLYIRRAEQGSSPSSPKNK